MVSQQTTGKSGRFGKKINLSNFNISIFFYLCLLNQKSSTDFTIFLYSFMPLGLFKE